MTQTLLPSAWGHKPVQLLHKKYSCQNNIFSKQISLTKNHDTLPSDYKLNQISVQSSTKYQKNANTTKKLLIEKSSKKLTHQLET